MYRQDNSRSYTQGDPDMYDEGRYTTEHRQSYDSKKDYARTSYDGRSDMRSEAPDRGYRQREGHKGYADDGTGNRSPHREGGRRRYTDRDREDYRSPSRDRSRSPRDAAPPHKTVVLEGLPTRATKEDIRYELENTFKVEKLEDVRLIFDKRTGQSRRFAFVQFPSIESAKAFVEPNFPAVQFPSSEEPSPVKVRISYSRDNREKDERPKAGEREDDWKCEVCFIANYAHRSFCFRCNGPRTLAAGIMNPGSQQHMSSFSGFATTGDSDVSPDNTPSQFLLLRGLEPGVTEELLAKGVTKLYKTKEDAPEAPAVKNSKITGKSKDNSTGAKEGSLQRVLLVRDRKSNDSWRYGFAEFGTVEDAQAAMAKYSSMDKFTISSKPVMVSYIHAGVFVPVLQAPAPEYEKFVFSPLHNPAVKLMYWDEAGYLTVLVTAKDDRSALDKAKERLGAKLAAAAANEGLVKDGDGKMKKRKAEKEATPNAKKVIAPHLQFWSNRHAELHGLPARENDQADSSISPAPEKDRDDELPPSKSFADLKRKCCLLCARQFKTEAEVHKHERVSQLHRDNLKNEALIAKAIAKLEKVGVVAPVEREDMDSAAYRDRAKERRQAFNQPKQPGAQHAKSSKAQDTSKVEEEQAAAPSKGAALLGKMGWTAGSGLGAQGTGRTEAISTELYAQGVGLGAEGGKVGDAVEEANRSTKSNYSDFVLKSKEKAKERYERMG